MRRAALAVAVAATVTAGLCAAAPAYASGTVTLARGVTLSHQTFHIKAGSRSLPQSVWTVSVTLSVHNTLVAAAPQRVTGAARITTLALGRQEKAVAGINGDTFYFSDPTAQPRGGITYNGHILKSALTDQQAVLYVTTAHKANIGNVGFSGSFSTGPCRLKSITSYNSLENARNGGITFTDRNLLSRSMPKCAVVGLAPTTTKGRFTVTSYAKAATRYTRVAAGRHAFVTCGAPGKAYLAQTIRVGHTLTASAGYRTKGITTLLSGARKLIAAGKRYTDKGGINVYGNQDKPETFACVPFGGRSVLFGTVEGGRSGASGMTYSQLTTYLLGRHCYAAMVFDGSTSSTLVAKRQHASLAVQNHTTHAGGPQKVVNGLYVVEK